VFATSPPSVLKSSVGTTRFLTRRWLAGAGAGLWHWLRRPWLAIMAGCLGVILSIAVWQLPQLPGQLVDEQAAAANWLLNASTQYGIWGNLLLTLGLFDVLRSPLLYLLLALLIPTLAAQFADQLGAFRQQRGLQSFDLTSVLAQPGDAIPISTARPLFRWRGMISASPDAVITALEAKIQHDFHAVSRAQVVPSPLPDPAGDSTEFALTPTNEIRLVGLRSPFLQYLRPLLMVGLLISVIGAWIALAFGWQVTSPPLAPESSFRSANRNLILHYSVPATDTLNSTLEASLQGEQVILPTNQARQQQLGPATILVRPAYAALWLAIQDGSARLTLPGESQFYSQLGLVFPTPGSEESVLIPDQGTGMRIVQPTDNNGFIIELYRSDAVEPIYRAELTPGGRLTIPFAPGDTELVISTLPGLQVDIRHLPGLWLVPLGILLAVIGAFAFVPTSSFVAVQIAAWASGYSLVVAQSDHPNLVADLRATLAIFVPESETSDAPGDEVLPPPLSQPGS
jgi:hypothetical protein